MSGFASFHWLPAERSIGSIAPVRLAVAVAIALSAIAFETASAQQPQTDPPGTGPAATDPPPAPAQPPGFFSAIGQWIDTSIAAATATMKGTRKATDAVGTAAKETVDQLTSLGGAKVATGHEPCEAAGAGPPDCTRAADALCRRKGWAARTMLDIQTVQKCPAHVWLSGGSPAENECRKESFVLRALCQ